MPPWKWVLIAGEQVDQFEESVFLYMDAVRGNTNPGANTTNVPGINDEYTARLNGSEADREVGPAKMIVVNAGDQLDVSVDYYHTGSYTDNGTISKANMITAIAGLFGGASTGSFQETAIYNQFNDPAASAIAYVGTRGNSANPRAYLNVVVFDKDFNMVSGSSAFQQTAATSGFGALSHSLTLSEGGYVYVYLSNESQTDFDVHFDNLEIEHTKGHILQEDHYYPFGANISALSSTAPLSKPNHFKYNSFEEQFDFDLGLYDYKARQYDPVLGRFTSVDPAADLMRRHSSYNYAFDNPMRFIDPDGMMPEEATDGGITVETKRYDKKGKEIKGMGLFRRAVRIETNVTVTNAKVLNQTTDNNPQGRKATDAEVKEAGEAMAQEISDTWTRSATDKKGRQVSVNVQFEGEIEVINDASEATKNDYVMTIVDDGQSSKGVLGKALAHAEVDGNSFTIDYSYSYLDQAMTKDINGNKRPIQLLSPTRGAGRVAAHEFGHSGGLGDRPGRNSKPGIMSYERSDLPNFSELWNFFSKRAFK